ncbi:hypothetical protein PAMC26577_23805 [Caballeronia sordidicola]|uniref:Uncharacterized protein n=1 Tax=Caballeronia sordidicola TaxID=196367 RepID=A0A242MJK3_CABSO|nr:hypothetical protein PAMC26577_23805 [Caballeronia sordidicola]
MAASVPVISHRSVAFLRQKRAAKGTVKVDPLALDDLHYPIKARCAADA